jgi:SAM-dependent methyltransferase
MRNITLPPVHNTRAPEQWRIISKHVDFEGKTVLDLGCGYGDLLWRAWAAGCVDSIGIDHNPELVLELLEREITLAGNVGFSCISIECAIAGGVLDGSVFGKWDTTICFSVLPYLANPTATLRWIREHSTQALIECQLAGDGPGFDWLESPQDMRRWLDSIGWKSVERIGETVIKDRGAKRGIWLCQRPF